MAREENVPVYKILVLGDSSVGKTCMINRFCDGIYHESYISTIGIDCKERTVYIEGKKIRLKIWDTAGQERFRTLTTAYYRGANGILLVYDITNVDSFNHLSHWIKNLSDMAPEDICTVIVGNKCDKAWERRVERQRGNKLAESHDMTFYETSSKTNINIDEAFLKLTRLIKEHMDGKMSKVSSPKVSSWDLSEGPKHHWCGC